MNVGEIASRSAAKLAYTLKKEQLDAVVEVNFVPQCRVSPRTICTSEICPPGRFALVQSVLSRCKVSLPNLSKMLLHTCECQEFLLVIYEVFRGI